MSTFICSLDGNQTTDKILKPTHQYKASNAITPVPTLFLNFIEVVKQDIQYFGCYF